MSYFDRTCEQYGTDTRFANGYKRDCLDSNFETTGPHRAPPQERVRLLRMKTVNCFKAVALMLCASFVALTFVSNVEAQTWNKRTIVKFSQMIEIPGVGQQYLPAGTYVFKLVDSVSNRDIVQIFSEDETHVFATILTIANYRLKATDETVMTFRERAAGQPEAIRAWFYPGANWGQEFVYAKSRAAELAKVTNEPVLATPIELAAAPIEALKTAPVESVAPTGETVELAKVVEAPPAKAADTQLVAVKTLPQTASWLPLLCLLGVLSLATGFGLWMFFKRDANQSIRVSNQA